MFGDHALLVIVVVNVVLFINFTVGDSRFSNSMCLYCCCKYRRVFWSKISKSILLLYTVIWFSYGFICVYTMRA